MNYKLTDRINAAYTSNKHNVPIKNQVDSPPVPRHWLPVKQSQRGWYNSSPRNEDLKMGCLLGGILWLTLAAICFSGKGNYSQSGAPFGAPTPEAALFNTVTYFLGH